MPEIKICTIILLLLLLSQQSTTTNAQKRAVNITIFRKLNEFLRSKNSRDK